MANETIQNQVDVTQALADPRGQAIPYADALSQLAGEVLNILTAGDIDRAKAALQGVVKAETMTFAEAAYNALTSPLKGEEPDGRRSFRRAKLAAKLVNATGTITLTTDEQKEIQEVVGKAYGPVVVGAVYTILNVDGAE